MNKPYHHASYQLTRMMQILGISTRAQWLRLLYQLTLPASADL
jgi:DNA-binding CsgD family transcriptional regulator